jgi:hypothetical protein
MTQISQIRTEAECLNLRNLRHLWFLLPSLPRTLLDIGAIAPSERSVQQNGSRTIVDFGPPIDQQSDA